MIKNCVMCNKEFEAKGNVVTCSAECNKKRKRIQNRDYARKVRGSSLATEKQKKVYKRVQLQLKNIAEINALARKAGLTYGEYVARCSDG